ncbi:MAG: tRNA (guanosine(37)-N1)-methyltransferase TrmD [Opitutales bacterium]|jgi:tRNA (guanine37-N1)-methyltransferase|nr:tRNA (guanosine(37)-N1)-methyltransferase TrmD [Opitutales bacterium]MDG2254867.1 tRNA (guanosine(37)-N1)-methyltransferase TrmD [Opitutaceae bacterium]MBT5169801.1 tRNA (guanosine(37)-N1)-methyltransferase TrmD [Opitutales bacterium]MBT5815261.1 tRNA (guanosine(37)-N1)-methyltransferase TrmD [Opitutales bacterium]MBT6380178.1 tRNA (guanosine(37)-N1)-methyltransferase TrmD [Opitutales bacterium]
MQIDVLTLFPQMLDGFLSESMMGRAQANGVVDVNVRNLRDWAKGKHKQVDDRPFGGGAGMVVMPEPIFDAIEELQTPKTHRIYLAPDGDRLTPELAQSLAKKEHLILLSGHYEGIDERARENMIDQEISIGDYVLTNGTLAAAVVIDCLCRFLPGFLGEEKSLTSESFQGSLLDFPQFTRPSVFRDMPIPEILLSGNHAEIEKWRQREREERTRERRPDLLED